MLPNSLPGFVGLISIDPLPAESADGLDAQSTLAETVDRLAGGFPTLEPPREVDPPLRTGRRVRGFYSRPHQRIVRQGFYLNHPPTHLSADIAGLTSQMELALIQFRRQAAAARGEAGP